MKGVKFTDKEWENLQTVHGKSEGVVLEFLKRNYPSAFIAQQIANELKINLKTTYYYLQVLFKNKKISRKKPFNRYVKNKEQYEHYHKKGCGKNFQKGAFLWTCGFNYDGEVRLCFDCLQKKSED